MTYKSIVTAQCADATEATALPVAVSVADAFDAHLKAIALAVNAVAATLSPTDLMAAALQTGALDAQTAARELTQQTAKALQGRSRVAIEPVVAIDGAPETALARHMRFADLAVLPAPYGPTGGACLVDLIETALFASGIPVLVCPPTTTGWTPPSRVLLAWNNGTEALRAARGALPFLQRADTCFITLIDPPTTGPDRSDPGGQLAEMLARHGVRCEIDVVTKNLPRVGDVIRQHALDRDADMLVMGAYGRARWSEAMFGGATRQLLETTPVPMLMAH